MCAVSVSLRIGYWLGQSLSFVGTQVTAVALPLVAALTLSAGPGQVGAIATAGMLPNLLFRSWSGIGWKVVSIGGS